MIEQFHTDHATVTTDRERAAATAHVQRRATREQWPDSLTADILGALGLAIRGGTVTDNLGRRTGPAPAPAPDPSRCDPVAVDRILAGTADPSSAHPDDRAAAVRHLAHTGLTVGQIAHKLGMNGTTVRIVLEGRAS